MLVTKLLWLKIANLSELVGFALTATTRIASSNQRGVTA